MSNDAIHMTGEASAAGYWSKAMRAGAYSRERRYIVVITFFREVGYKRRGAGVDQGCEVDTGSVVHISPDLVSKPESMDSLSKVLGTASPLSQSCGLYGT
jgi:hypothetical protein